MDRDQLSPFFKTLLDHLSHNSSSQELLATKLTLPLAKGTRVTTSHSADDEKSASANAVGLNSLPTI
jgi:hypothetical protein